MRKNRYIITNANNTKAIFIESAPYGFRLKKAEKNLKGEWCNSIARLEGGNIFRTLKAATAKANEILIKI